MLGSWLPCALLRVDQRSDGEIVKRLYSVKIFSSEPQSRPKHANNSGSIQDEGNLSGVDAKFGVSGFLVMMSPRYLQCKFMRPLGFLIAADQPWPLAEARTMAMPVSKAL